MSDKGKLDLTGLYPDNDETVNKNVTVNTSETVNKFVTISRKPRRRFNVPMTYRLDPATVDKIADLAVRSGMGVSEFLQAVLDKVLDEIDIA
jgi:hypothetical protein